MKITKPQMKKLSQVGLYLSEVYGNLGSLPRPVTTETEELSNGVLLVAISFGAADHYDWNRPSFVFCIGKKGGLRQTQRQGGIKLLNHPSEIKPN